MVEQNLKKSSSPEADEKSTGVLLTDEILTNEFFILYAMRKKMGSDIDFASYLLKTIISQGLCNRYDLEEALSKLGEGETLASYGGYVYHPSRKTLIVPALDVTLPFPDRQGELLEALMRARGNPISSRIYEKDAPLHLLTPSIRSSNAKRLRVYIRRLRDAVPAIDPNDGSPIRTTSGGYVFEPDLELFRQRYARKLTRNFDAPALPYDPYDYLPLQIPTF